MQPPQDRHFLEGTRGLVHAVLARDDGSDARDGEKLAEGMKRPMIVGQAPAKGNDGKPPFAGKSGARLARLAGVGDSGDALPHHFKLVNLIEKYPGRGGDKGDLFDREEAGAKAMEVLSDLIRGKQRRWVLLMGRNVARCFGQSDREYLVAFGLTPWAQGLVFPHPSGINRWWNSTADEERAAHWMKKVLVDGR
jgi:uracil-DNA glycosylase